MSRFQCFIDTSDITECYMIVLPSPSALENDSPDYYDDYYVQIMLSSVEGKVYGYNMEPQPKESTPSAAIPAPPAPAEAKKQPVATVHFKVNT